MPHEAFFDCMRIGCFVSDTLVKKQPIAIWPQIAPDQSLREDVWKWSFYIEWRPGEGTHVTKYLCEMHHNQMLRMAETSALADVREQELTERWLTQVASQAFRSS